MIAARLFEGLTRSPESDCWLWTGMRIKKGYGKIRSGKKMVATHRLMYALVTGKELPQSVHVLHRCDTPACCNPGHLFEGDNTLNIADKVKKDRSGKKLKIASATEVKNMVASGLTQRAVADRFGLNPSTVSRIVAGIRWSHLNEGKEAEQASLQ